MRKALPCVVAALAVAVLPQALAAQQPKRPGHPGPEMLFQRLDANKDGAISADELPDGLPDRIKQALIRADRNKDKKVTVAEMKEAMKRHPSGSRQRPQRPPASAGHGPRPQIPGPKELFIRMDKNKDKQLSLEEFAEGMKRVHHGMAARRPGGPQQPPQAHHPGRPAFAGRPGTGHAPPGERLAMIGRKIFEKADRNRDGKISLDEVPEHRREGFKKILEKADKDGDKALSGEEAKAVAAAIGKRIRAHAAGKVGEIGKKIFVKLDADKDGKITLAEVPAERREGFKRLLEKADKDGDKALNAEEAKRVAAYVSQRIRSGQAPGHRPESFKHGERPGQKPEASRGGHKKKKDKDRKRKKEKKPKKE